MPAAPDGSVVKLYVDLCERVAVGDLIETQTGRRYGVLVVREQQRGKHRGRQHLSCVVIGADRSEPGPGVRLHRIRWYKR